MRDAACSACANDAAALVAEALAAVRLGNATVTFALAEISGLARLVAELGDDRLRVAVLDYTAKMPERLRVVLAESPSDTRH
jgi:hypothetical protein